MQPDEPPLRLARDTGTTYKGNQMRSRALTAFLPALATALAMTIVAPAHAATRHRLLMPFSREVVHPGAVDVDPYHIAHVYEVQYRLKRAGLFRAAPNGQFGPLTERAVKRFQRRNHLRPTGVVNQQT